MLLLNIPGEGEKAMTSGTMFDGIQTEEAKAVEEPMFKELGTMESMKKPEGVTAAVNWYRYACQAHMQHLVIPVILIPAGQLKAVRGKHSVLFSRHQVSKHSVIKLVYIPWLTHSFKM